MEGAWLHIDSVVRDTGIMTLSNAAKAKIRGKYLQTFLLHFYENSRMGQILRQKEAFQYFI
jgi:hypothetical protein